MSLYRRPDCPLCDEAERLLATLAARIGFRVEAIDIEQDETLHRQYLLEIPVVTVGDREVARAPIRADSLEAALQAALGPLPEG